jgi:hypothetical protein
VVGDEGMHVPPLRQSPILHGSNRISQLKFIIILHILFLIANLFIRFQDNYLGPEKPGGQVQL